MPLKPTPLPHQTNVFNRLVALGRACFQADRKALPIRPRFNSLVIGPSGSGKTFLAKAVADALNVPLLVLTVADWILLSCRDRGGKITWHVIVEFLHRHRGKEGVLIFCDEVQHACGDCAWERFLRVELFSLLDLKIPQGLEVEVEEKGGDEITLKGDSLRPIEEMLQRKVFLVGAGAFQEIWEERGNRIGFRDAGREMMPTSSNLTKTLPTELINRFRLDLLTLKPLLLADYEQMLEVAAEKLAPNLRAHFLKLGRQRLPEVHRLRQGSRFLEELLCDTLIEEERHRIFVPDPPREPFKYRDPWGES